MALTLVLCQLDQASPGALTHEGNNDAEGSLIQVELADEQDQRHLEARLQEAKVQETKLQRTISSIQKDNRALKKKYDKSQTSLECAERECKCHKWQELKTYVHQQQAARNKESFLYLMEVRRKLLTIAHFARVMPLQTSPDSINYLLTAVAECFSAQAKANATNPDEGDNMKIPDEVSKAEGSWLDQGDRYTEVERASGACLEAKTGQEYGTLLAELQAYEDALSEKTELAQLAAMMREELERQVASRENAAVEYQQQNEALEAHAAELLRSKIGLDASVAGLQNIVADRERKVELAEGRATELAEQNALLANDVDMLRRDVTSSRLETEAAVSKCSVLQAQLRALVDGRGSEMVLYESTSSARKHEPDESDKSELGHWTLERSIEMSGSKAQAGGAPTVQSVVSSTAGDYIHSNPSRSLSDPDLWYMIGALQRSLLEREKELQLTRSQRKVNWLQIRYQASNVVQISDGNAAQGHQGGGLAQTADLLQRNLAADEGGTNTPESWVTIPSIEIQSRLERETNALQTAEARVSTLEKANAELQAQIEEETGTLQAKREEETSALRERLEEETNVLQARASALETANAELQARIEEETGALQKTEARASALEKANAELQALLEEETSALQAKREEETNALHDVQAQASALEKANAELQAQFEEETAALQARLEEETDALHAAQARASALETANAELQARIDEETGALRKVEARASALETANAELQTRIDEETGALRKVEARASALETANAELQTRIDEETGALRKVEARASALETANAELQARIEEETGALQKTEARASALEKANAELQALLEEETSALQAKREEETNALHDVQAQASALEKANAELQAQFEEETAALQARLEEETDALHAAQARASALETANAELQARIDEETGALRKVEARASALEKANAELKTLLEEKTNVLQAKRGALHDAQARASALEEANVELQMRVDGIRALQAKREEEISALQARLEEETSVLQKVKARASALEKANAELQTLLEDETNALQAKREEGTSALRMVEAQVSALDKVNAERQARIGGLQAKRKEEAGALRKVEALAFEMTNLEVPARLKKNSGTFPEQQRDSNPQRSETVTRVLALQQVGHAKASETSSARAVQHEQGTTVVKQEHDLSSDVLSRQPDSVRELEDRLGAAEQPYRADAMGRQKRSDGLAYTSRSCEPTKDVEADAKALRAERQALEIENVRLRKQLQKEPTVEKSCPQSSSMLTSAPSTRNLAGRMQPRIHEPVTGQLRTNEPDRRPSSLRRQNSFVSTRESLSSVDILAELQASKTQIRRR
ncbi:uncharacterized protein SCHCODRAFT_01170138 [Schizophyllum commune H4-8]|uniref:Uncharacterized protein n=1 Tax=Schizophyllum commune (strain H4-8 / FGSC 9210) TaxID=578458 RepID=D8Q2D9_SCHCM|nr:uncharacterized protein SCHCODRAFT_01170138 [Schizophyllum commune H4-8]KAI5895827.1 hypothetical protein SCHCODRAFT_01170138 [Schizophyllum commune H4-8]